MGNYRFILSGGGTGGHIYPAIAIANELKRRLDNVEILFVGARDRMEMEKVPQAGYKIEGLWISGLERKISWKNLVFPFKVIHSLIRARNIVKSFKPDVVIGTGGFASGPVLRMATMKNIPSVLQEQNSFAGITNKLLASKVNKICVAYSGMEKFFPAEKIVRTGNPVRSTLIKLPQNRAESYAVFNLESHTKTVLVLGGSQGSRKINQLIESRLSFFKDLGIQLIWQCGALYYEEYKKYQDESIKVYGFLNQMEHAFNTADVIISRSGAGAVSELCLVGKPVILIPSPNVAEDHQKMNALALVKEDAAIMILEKDLEKEFNSCFSKLISSKIQMAKLGKKIKELALPEATEQIVDEIIKLIPKNNG